MYWIIATVAGETDSSRVDVQAPDQPPVPAFVEVTPGYIQLYPGQNAAVTAVVTDTAGTPIAVPIVWSVTGGTFVAGTYVAGSTPGNYQISAAAQGGGVADTIPVKIILPGTPANHEPPGYSSFAENPLDSRPGAPGDQAVGHWALFPPDDPDVTIVADPFAPGSAPGVLQTRFPAGLPAGVAPTDLVGWDSSGTERSKLYISFWLKIDGQGFENQASGTKLGFIAFGRQNAGNNEGTFWLDNGTGSQSVQQSMKVQFRIQGIPQPDGTVTRNLTQNLSSARVMTTNIWHQWEAVLELNTVGRGNGIFRLWIDGVEVMDYRDVTYITPSTPAGFHFYQWNPTWGGSGGVRSRTDYILMDQLYLSGVP
ncbi:MAG: Ig-like domain-containing protein [Gemmatimonadales bacterium]